MTRAFSFYGFGSILHSLNDATTQLDNFMQEMPNDLEYEILDVFNKYDRNSQERIITVIIRTKE